MDYRRLAIAAAVAWVVDSVYGFVVFGVFLNSEFARYPNVFRSYREVNAMLPLMFGASLVGILAIAYIFAKGHEGRPGMQEGVRFGFVYAIFGLFAISIPNYVIFDYGGKLALEGAIASFIEMFITGVILGVFYKPAPAARRAAAV